MEVFVQSSDVAPGNGRWTERLRRDEPGQGRGDPAGGIPWAGGRGVARRDIQPRETTMSPLRTRMIEDMILAGLAERTRNAYVRAVWQLTAYYRRAPDQLSEDEVRRYLFPLINQSA